MSKILEMASVTATTPIEEEVSEKTVDENAECYICHKVGHVSRGCPDRVCPVCKKGGDEGNHPIRECPMKAEKKKSKKPGRKKTHAARARQVSTSMKLGLQNVQD